MTEIATEVKRKKGDKRVQAFEIVKTHFSNINTFDFAKCIEEMSEKIDVNPGGARSYFSFFAKEEHNNFKIPGLNTYWQENIKNKKSGSTTKETAAGETKSTKPNDGGTVLKKGGSTETLQKLKDVLNKKKKDPLADALKAAHPERPQVETPATADEKIAA